VKKMASPELVGQQFHDTGGGAPDVQCTHRAIDDMTHLIWLIIDEATTTD
jgi:hypothetical protein